jgi:replicative DNA helicase
MPELQLFSDESESTVIASILQIPTLIHAINGLRHYMFSSAPHQILMKEMEDLKEKNLLPDPTLVVASLNSQNTLSKAGGKQYVDILLKKQIVPDSFKKFVEIVILSYKGRSFISTLSGVKAESLNATNVDDTIVATRKSLDALMEMKEAGSVVSVGDVARKTYEEILARRDHPGIRGTTWGATSLDSATGGKAPGDLWVIGGRPGQGKTALICNSILADGINGIPSLLIEREMRIQELMERLVCIHSGVNNDKIRFGTLDQKEADAVYDSLEVIKKFPIYLDTNFMSNDPMYVEATVNKYVNTRGVQVVYADYIQIMTDRDDGQTQAIGRMTRLMKILANDLNLCTILLSQLNRNVESRDNKRPLLSDFKMSGSMEEDADYAIGLYRDEHYHPETTQKNRMEFMVLKNRNGPAGLVTLKFEGPTYRIGDL